MSQEDNTSRIDEDEDFGDFEDFESAAVEEVQAPVEKIVPQEPIVEIPSLADLISDTSLFVDEITTVEDSETIPLYDLLEKCDENNVFEKCDKIESYLEIWNDLKIIEDTRALKFNVGKSTSYNSFLEALQMNIKKVVPNSLEFLTLTSSNNINHNNTFPESTINNLASPEDRSSTEETTNVPQATFDWQEFGLSNDVHVSDVLIDIDVFLQDKGNGKEYSLQGDLSAFGCEDKIAKTTFLGEAKLSVVGKALYEKLPDYSFMMSKIVAFPQAS
uniref:Condensin complex subunit 2 n=1 Tax=Rhabditophanes sp. KR3021 TaxID=114890 RepID=A0AC35TTY9_9BILA